MSNARAALNHLSVDHVGRPAEILLVREVADPMPGQLLEAGLLNPRWCGALQSELRNQRRRAISARGLAAHPDAGAIVFADEAQMLALFLEAHTQSRTHVWWWRSALAHFGLSVFNLTEILCARPRIVPAAIAQMNAEITVKLLTDTSTETLQEICESVLREFAVSADAAALLPGVLTRVGVYARDLANERKTADRKGIPETRSDPGTKEVPQNLFGGQVAADDPLLSPQLRFLGLMRLLAVSPHQLATSLATVLEVSLQRFCRGSDIAALTAQEKRVPYAAAESSRHADTQNRPAEPTNKPLHIQTADGRPERVFEDKAPWGGGQEPASPEFAREVRPGVPDKPDHNDPPSSLDELQADGTRTTLAGLFYLLNLCDEPAHWRPWDWLARLAEALLEQLTNDVWRTDPVWQLLKALDEAESDTVQKSLSEDQALELAVVRRQVTSDITAAFELPVAEALNECLAVPGWVYLSATHIDVMLRMQDIRVPVRLSGWDLNPGWRPEFGRIFTFHFRDQDE